MSGGTMSGPRREQLAELDERRAELVEHLAQVPAALGAGRSSDPARRAPTTGGCRSACAARRSSRTRGGPRPGRSRTGGRSCGCEGAWPWLSVARRPPNSRLCAVQALEARPGIAQNRNIVESTTPRSPTANSTDPMARMSTRDSSTSMATTCGVGANRRIVPSEVHRVPGGGDTGTTTGTGARLEREQPCSSRQGARPADRCHPADGDGATVRAERRDRQPRLA